MTQTFQSGDTLRKPYFSGFARFFSIIFGSAIDPYLEEIAKHIPRDRKTLIFLPLIATSARMAQILKSLGHKAEHIAGVSSERKEIKRPETLNGNRQRGGRTPRKLQPVGGKCRVVER